jgi:hypothetical protein
VLRSTRSGTRTHQVRWYRCAPFRGLRPTGACVAGSVAIRGSYLLVIPIPVN